MAAAAFWNEQGNLFSKLNGEVWGTPGANGWELEGQDNSAESTAVVAHFTAMAVTAGMAAIESAIRLLETGRPAGGGGVGEILAAAGTER